jgi:hypothetical protein
MRQLTIERAAVVIIFALLLALAVRIPTDTDTWWHIRSGEHTLTDGFIYADPFSFTMQGEPWTNHSWGSQALMYAVWQIGGNFGLVLFTAGLATGGMVFVYRMSSGNVYLRGFALVLGAATAAVFWSARPQMLSFFLSAVVLYLLFLFKYKKIDRLWLLPVVMGIWGNLHAGFSIGFIFLGAVIVGEIVNHLLNPQGEHIIAWKGIRKLILVSLVSAAALVINPYGLNMLLVPFQTVSIGALREFIQEWNSPNFHERQTWPFIALLVGLLGAAGASNRRMDWTEWFLVSGTAFMGLLAGRNIAVFAVVATPVLTWHLDTLLQERGWVLRSVKFATLSQARLNAILIGVISLAALAKIVLVLDAETVYEAQSTILPVAAAEYLEAENPPGNMFNSYNWGGYLMFAAPQYPVYVDGRTDLYGSDFLVEWRQVALGGGDWRTVLDEADINLVVVENGSGLARNLEEADDWRLDYEDDLAVVYVRE